MTLFSSMMAFLGSRKALGYMVVAGTMLFAAMHIFFWSSVTTWTELGSDLGVARCRVMIKEYGIKGHHLEFLPEHLRREWKRLNCPRLIKSHELRVAEQFGIDDGDDEGVEEFVECAALCNNSWSTGDWTTWCEEGTDSCAQTFIPSQSRCLYRFFDSQDTAKCLADQWVIVIGGSGAMNLGLTWLMSLDPEGTQEPFLGPAWYNLTCYTAGRKGKSTCSKDFYQVALSSHACAAPPCAMRCSVLTERERELLAGCDLHRLAEHGLRSHHER
eukprot:1752293-Rhodomonas_salina.2